MTPYDASSPQVQSAPPGPLIDAFGRTVTYLRVSVTDRCDLRCVYCMAEHMTFLPKAEVLTLEELDRIASAFVGLGVKKLRITGGEPLVRKGVMGLFESLGAAPEIGRAGRDHADHQRHAAGASSPGSWPTPGVQADQCLAGYAEARTCSAR